MALQAEVDALRRENAALRERLAAGEVSAAVDRATLQGNEALARIAGRMARLGGWSFDLSVGRVIWSDEVAAIHEKPPGFSPTLEEGISFYAPEWRDLITLRFQACAQEGVPYDEELQLITATGQRIWVRASGEALRDDQGHIYGVQGAFQEITTRKETEEALRRSETLFRSLFDDHSAVKLLVDPLSGAIVDANRAAEAFYGWPLATLKNMRIQDINPLTEDEIQTEMAAAPERQRSYFEFRHRRADGQERDVAVFRSTIVVHGRQLLHDIIHDITEHKRAEAERSQLQLIINQTQKMESIGRLAGGVAHDFNNLLAVILSYTDFALSSLHPGDPLSADLREIQAAADRATHLTRQLLAFSRKQVLEAKVLNLNEVIADTERMLGRLIGEDIEVRHILAPDLGLFMADPGQIEQVLMNLAVNARDAMPMGGTLLIETTNIQLNQAYVNKRIEVKPVPYVCLAVSDTGCGMDATTQAQIFEPFFTTKTKDRGTGLGLATVYGIVRQSDGAINVYSEPGQGTTFKVYFPRLPDDTITHQPEMPTRAVHGGNECILVVEDEAAMRKVAVRMLRAQGYSVLAAANGGEALLLCEQYPGTIDLLITDVIMPQMNGRVLAERLLALRPELRVLYMSGYSNNLIVQHGVLEPGIRFIAKPFNNQDLAAKVQDCLDGHE